MNIDEFLCELTDTYERTSRPPEKLMIERGGSGSVDH